MQIFSRLTITLRIYLLVFLAALGMGSVLLVASQEINESLFSSRSEQTRRLVESAASLLKEYTQRASTGEMSIEEAQKRAMDRISQMRYDGTNYFWINDLQGKMVMHPTSPKMVGTDITGIKDARGDTFFAGMIAVAKKSGEGPYTYYWPPDNTAKEKVSYVKSIPEWGWMIGSGVFVDDVQKDIDHIESKLLYITLGLILAALLVALFIGKSITNPLKLITKDMEELANGNLDITIEMGDRRDEVGTMAKTVIVFQENAKQVERLKAEQAERDRRAAEEKKATMEKMATDFEASIGNIVGVVASAATELQANSKNLSEISDQTNRQASTVAAATEEASASVQTVASAAEELSASIEEINRQVSESTRVAQNAVSEVKKTDQTVSTLSEAATQIGDVVKLIQDIAEQTNLLALNATIEAARAGEAGKGFAVVASEVKNLATQTGRATEEISKKIITVQSVSTQSVSAIRDIGKTIEHINEITNVIANAIQQQNAATKEISNNVQQASAGTSEVSRSIVDVTHAATESRNAADEVLQASGELSRQSERLRSEISGFLNKVRQG